MAMYAGTGVGEVTASQPAADVVANLVSLLQRPSTFGPVSRIKLTYSTLRYFYSGTKD
jgi:hypothetical protein